MHQHIVGSLETVEYSSSELIEGRVYRMKKIITFLTLIAAAACAAPQPNQTVPYKETPQGELRLHIFKPNGLKPGQKRPAVVFYFEGGWNSGSPSQFYPQAR